MYKMPEVTNYHKKDNTYCCVPLCTSRGSKNPDLSFHLFPSEKKELARRTKWILALRIGKPVTSRMSVCSRHFVHSDYVLPPHYERKRPRLRKHAIPSLNLPPPDGYKAKPEKRPMTIRIRKEPTSAEAVGEESDENAEQEDLEIEVNIKSERDCFGTYHNSEYEQDNYGTDYNSDSDQDCFRTDYNIESKQDYTGTNYNNESEQNYSETVNIKYKRDYLDINDNSESERDDIQTENNFESQREDLIISDISESELVCYLDTEDNVDFEQDYSKRRGEIESRQRYLETESDGESEQEDLPAGKNIKPMTLMTLSKILI